MSSGACSSCGRPLPAGAQVCPSCGAAVLSGLGSGVSPTAGGPPSSGAFGISGGAGPGGGRGEWDRRGLDRFLLAAVIGLVSSGVSVASIVLERVSPLVSSSPQTTGTTIQLGSAVSWAGVVGAGAVLGLVWVVLLQRGFAALAPVDRRFSTPATLAWVLILGALLAVAGLPLLFGALSAAIACAGPSHLVTAGCLNGTTFWEAVALIAIGGIVALVGAIGVLVGIWRLGQRYADGRFKIAAILLIFPLLNLVGQIMILVAAREQLSRLPAARPPPGVGV